MASPKRRHQRCALVYNATLVVVQPGHISAIVVDGEEKQVAVDDGTKKYELLDFYDANEFKTLRNRKIIVDGVARTDFLISTRKPRSEQTSISMQAV